MLITTLQERPIQISFYTKGAPIAYTLLPTPCGQAVLFTTPKGICGLHFLTTPLSLTIALMASHFRVTPYLSNNLTSSCDQYLNASSTPLIVAATPFQIRVWERVAQIPPGESRTYQAIASQLGNINYARAVGNALAANLIAYLIPCHRVRRKNHTLGGYRWGDHLKKRLLQQEDKYKTIS